MVFGDRGFYNIEDMLVEKSTRLIIPPFLKGRKGFTEEEVKLAKLIVHSRIGVERFNQRIKNYRILTNTVPYHL